MTSYYLDKLYPLQDEVLQLIKTQLKDQQFELYLTGGTCLSRCYFNHRFSDDLDFFYHVSDSNLIMQRLIPALNLNFQIKTLAKDADRSEFISVQINQLLKLDIVRDVGEHFGEFAHHELYSPIDNLDNILANKISAIMGRDEAKDVVDLWSIAQNYQINWPRIFTAVDSKASGIMPPLVAKRLVDFPVEWLKRINWSIQPPSAKQFLEDINKISNQIINY